MRRPTLAPMACGSGLLAALLLAAPPALASPAPAAHDRSAPTSTVFGFETVALPEGERMGLLGGSLLVETAPGWWLGPGVYGAATGQRGGLFVLGAEVQRRWRLGPGQLVAGVYGGGGGGAAAPVGGGLMWRPHLAWLHDLGPLQAGLSWSAVRFPTGRISGSQIGLLVAWDGRLRWAEPGRSGTAAADDGRSGAGWDRLLGTATVYGVRGDGVPERRVGLVGARLLRDGPVRADGWRTQAHWGLELHGAATGGSGGYMEILGTGGWDVALTPGGALRAGARVALGLAGGGALPTRGGVIGKLAVGGSLALGPAVSLGGELGWMRAAQGSLRAPTAQAWLSVALEPVPGAGGLRSGTLARHEWTPALQRYTAAERRVGGPRPLDTVGLKLARYAGEHLYGTVQAHSAYAGGAGAYAVGLVGAGLATSARDARWRAGAELTLGAAGGGGVDSGGGAIVQGLAWAGVVLQPGLELRLGAGAVRGRQPGLGSPVLELSLTRAFGQLVP